MDAQRALVRHDIQKLQLSLQQLRNRIKETQALAVRNEALEKRLQAFLDEGNRTIWYALQELVKS
jgi:cell fate (sporulation/competence/biofilm development) regulator YlbF (YheA/YmcA/DUF963 family)